jgi:5-(carboxyamino)imidazole ribonucleotide mutase
MSLKRIVPIVMGSDKDQKFADGISPVLQQFGIPHEYRVASGHKHPEYVLRVIGDYDPCYDQVVYIAVAGRSDALSPTLSVNTVNPVIACPPYDEKFAGLYVLSSLGTPSDTPSTVALEPANAALAAVKIFASSDGDLRRQLSDYMAQVKQGIEKADAKVRGIR